MKLVSLGRQSIYEKENSDTKPTGPPGLGVGGGANTPVPENRLVTETATTNPENNLAPGESSPVEPMMRAGESLREASAQTTLLTAKIKTRIGTWNIRTLYETGKSAQVSREMHRYNLKMLGLCETRWNGTGRTRLTSGDTIIYSGHEEGHPHLHGVALLLTPEAAQALLSWEPVSPRLLTARFNSKGRKSTVIQCYAPTNAAETEEKEAFYEQLQAVMDKLPRRDLKILMGDLNAKVGADNTNRELIMGKHGVGVQNENGELLTEFCTFNDLVIGGTVFQHKQIHKTTWTSPDGRTVNQIDHVTIGRKWRRSLLDVRVKRGADAASDHHLVVADLKFKLKVYRDRADRPSHKYNIHSLKDKTKAEVYQCELRNRFSALAHQPEESVEETWCGLRDTWKVTCIEVLGKKTRQHKEWLSANTWTLIKERKQLKNDINQTQDL